MIDALALLMIGILAGIFFRRLLFSTYAPMSLLKKIVPTLEASILYGMALSDLIATNAINPVLAAEKRQDFEASLLTQYSSYPESIFKSGFNPGLRAGFRSFLINIDRLGELLFAIEFICLKKKDDQLMQSLAFLSGSLAIAMENNEKILQVILAYARKEELTEMNINFIDDIKNLEGHLKELVPDNLAMLELSANYTSLSSLVRCIRDLRQVLLKILASITSAPRNAP